MIQVILMIFEISLCHSSYPPNIQWEMIKKNLTYYKLEGSYYTHIFTKPEPKDPSPITSPNLSRIKQYKY